MTAINTQSRHFHHEIIAILFSTTANLPLLLASYWKKEQDDFKVKVVAKPTTNIAQVKLLLKVLNVQINIWLHCKSRAQRLTSAKAKRLIT